MTCEDLYDSWPCPARIAEATWSSELLKWGLTFSSSNIPWFIICSYYHVFLLQCAYHSVETQIIALTHHNRSETLAVSLSLSWDILGQPQLAQALLQFLFQLVGRPNSCGWPHPDFPVTSGGRSTHGVETEGDLRGFNPSSTSSTKACWHINVINYIPSWLYTISNMWAHWSSHVATVSRANPGVVSPSFPRHKATLSYCIIQRTSILPLPAVSIRDIIDHMGGSKYGSPKIDGL